MGRPVFVNSGSHDAEDDIIKQNATVHKFVTAKITYANTAERMPLKGHGTVQPYNKLSFPTCAKFKWHTSASQFRRMRFGVGAVFRIHQSPWLLCLANCFIYTLFAKPVQIHPCFCDCVPLADYEATHCAISVAQSANGRAQSDYLRNWTYACLSAFLVLARRLWRRRRLGVWHTPTIIGWC